MIYAINIETGEMVTSMPSQAFDSYETMRNELITRGYTILKEEVTCLGDMLITVW